MACVSCGGLVDCPDLPASELYSLQNQTFPYVIECPPGYNCQTGTDIYFQCCTQLLHGTLPTNPTPAQITAVLNALAAQCAILGSGCGELISPPTTPTTFYWNTPQTCIVLCPDGNSFSWTIPAGTVAGATQSKANAAAYSLACQKAISKRFCLSDLNPSLACYGIAYTGILSANGPVSTPCNWSISSGSLPGGLSLGASTSQFETITGTPTVSGSFTFTIQCEGSDGTVSQKTYTLCINQISPTSLPAGQVGVPYNQTLTFAGCSPGTTTFLITSGSLPAGLTMNVFGTISGIPTGAPSSNPITVKAISQTVANMSCSQSYTLVIGNPNVCISNTTDWTTLTTAYSGISVTIGNTTFAFSGGPPDQWCNSSPGCISEVVDNTGGSIAYLPSTWCLVVGDAFPGFGNKATIYTNSSGPSGHFTFNSKGPSAPASPPAFFDLVIC